MSDLHYRQNKIEFKNLLFENIIESYTITRFSHLVLLVSWPAKFVGTICFWYIKFEIPWVCYHFVKFQFIM